VDDGRRTLMFGEAPQWSRFGIVTVISALTMQIGYAWFMRTKRWFSDVL
jgi:lipopolysaccharide transport system permease protein